MPTPFKEPRYRTRFTVAAHLYSPSQTEREEVLASIDKLKGLVPSDIDPEQHPTILYVVGNLFVAGVLNKNDDGVTLEDSLVVARAFEGQQVNIEHSRGNVVGYIVKVGFSEFGTDRLITEEEARAADKPFNIAVVIALWKVVDSDLTRFILDTARSESANKDALSLSFEVGFDNYSIVTVPKGTSNLALATRVIKPTASEFTKWDAMLRVNGGGGAYGPKKDRIGRVLLEGIIPLGAGIVTTPAGAVKGLAPVTTNVPLLSEIDEEEAALIEAGMYKFSSTQVTLGPTEAADFLAYAASIPEEHLYHGEEGTDSYGPKYGREDEPHVTALFGIRGNEAGPLELSLQGCGPIRARLGLVSSFVNDDKPYDVLKIDVESDDLHRLHALIKASADCEEQWPNYHPHLTIAYLKKGLSTQYGGDARFQGRELTFSSLTFSPAEGNRVEIPLLEPSLPVQAPATIASTALLPLSVDDMANKKVTLTSVDETGKRMIIEMDAAEAWQETNRQIETYRKILDWLKED